MIVLCDEKAINFGELYHVSDTGKVTAVRYGPGQLQHAKEYIPRSVPYYSFKKAIKSWSYIPESGVVRACDKDQLPKPLQLYLMLLED